MRPSGRGRKKEKRKLDKCKTYCPRHLPPIDPGERTGVAALLVGAMNEVRWRSTGGGYGSPWFGGDSARKSAGGGGGLAAGLPGADAGLPGKRVLGAQAHHHIDSFEY